MKEIRINSPKYPAIGLMVSDRPKIGGPGSFEFAIGQPYEVADPVVEEIQRQIAGFREGVRKVLSLEVRDLAPVAAATAGAVQSPPKPKEVESSTPVDPVEPSPDTLSEDDLALVQIEVDKLLAKNTIAEREPLLIGAAGNDDLPKVLRLAYLDALLAHPEVQKGLKEIAQEWRDTVEAAG